VFASSRFFMCPFSLRDEPRARLRAAGDGRPLLVRDDRTIAKKHLTLDGFFRYALARSRLKSSPMPSFERQRGATLHHTLHLLRSRAEAHSGSGAGGDRPTLRDRRRYAPHIRAAPIRSRLRRGEACRLKEDVDLDRSLPYIKGTKFFKTRIVPINACLSKVLKAFVAKHTGIEMPVSEK
jgi:hypothetical protein